MCGNMFYQWKKTKTLPPVVKRPFQNTFSNEGLSNFRQRRPFSNALDEKSYEPPDYAGNTESRMIEPVPVDLSRGARDQLNDYIGQSTTSTTTTTGGGGGGGTVTGSGTANKITKWTSGSAIGNSVMTESGGNIGVSQSSPTERLHVDGTVKCTGFDMATGASNGYVMTSDGAGVGTWQVNSGSSGVTKAFVVAMAAAL